MAGSDEVAAWKKAEPVLQNEVVEARGEPSWTETLVACRSCVGSARVAIRLACAGSAVEPAMAWTTAAGAFWSACSRP